MRNTPDSDWNDAPPGNLIRTVAVFEKSAGPPARSPITKPSVGSPPATSTLATKRLVLPSTRAQSPNVLKVWNSSGLAVELTTLLPDDVRQPTEPATWSVSA